VTLVRVNERGHKFGPLNDNIVAEVVIQLPQALSQDRAASFDGRARTP
jgi:hypothetical protein